MQTVCGQYSEYLVGSGQHRIRHHRRDSGVANFVDDALDHRSKELKRHALMHGTEAQSVKTITEFQRAFEVFMTTPLLPHVSVHTEMLAHVIHLKEAVMTHCSRLDRLRLHTFLHHSPVANVMNKEIKFTKQSPSFYAGDALHAIKQEKLQKALEQSGFDAFLEPEYVALVVKGTPPVVGYISGCDDLRIQFKSDIQDARRLPHVSKWHEVIEKMLSDYGVSRGRIATDIMPHMVYTGLTKACPELEIGDVTPIWLQLTAVKHPIEVDLIRTPACSGAAYHLGTGRLTSPSGPAPRSPAHCRGCP